MFLSSVLLLCLSSSYGVKIPIEKKTMKLPKKVYAHAHSGSGSGERVYAYVDAEAIELWRVSEMEAVMLCVRVLLLPFLFRISLTYF